SAAAAGFTFPSGGVGAGASPAKVAADVAAVSSAKRDSPRARPTLGPSMRISASAEISCSGSLAASCQQGVCILGRFEKLCATSDQEVLQMSASLPAAVRTMV